MKPAIPQTRCIFRSDLLGPRLHGVLTGILFTVLIATSVSLGQETSDLRAGNSGDGNPKIRVLIVDGQNNHAIWPRTTEMMKAMLEEAGIFSVSIARTGPKGTDPDFQPEFEKYDVVVSNYNGAAWPETTQLNFDKFVSGGGGFVVIHAADNSFPEWPAYNRMIGIGGWGNRNEKSGPWIYYDDRGELVRNKDEGRGGSHGPQHEFVIQNRSPDHPIMQGVPENWLHTQDELYDSLRGPAENVTILATAFSSPDKNGTGRHEPMMMAIEYGKGRVFHSTLGHADYSMSCAGFVAMFKRGVEWAATGVVTQPLPEVFPAADKTEVWQMPIKVEKTSTGSIRNCFAAGDFLLSGVPQPEDFPLLAESGIKTVISLQKENEIAWDEGKTAADSGLSFERFPVGSANDLGDELLDEIRGKMKTVRSDNRMLIHCAGAVRVGAIWAAWLAIDCGASQEEAFAEAKKLGLNNEAMIERVRSYINRKLGK